MKAHRTWALSAGLALVAGAALGQGATPLLKYTFDDDDGGWTATGTNARATITQQTSFNGRGSLKFEYDVKPGARSMLVLATPNGLPPQGRTFRLWVNADTPTTLAIMLHEKDGGRYMAPFAVQKGKWQEVALSTADFVLSEGPGDPKDPDGKLDLDQVANIAILDVLQSFGVADNPDMAKLLNVQSGPRTLRLDDFMVTAEVLPGAFTAPNGDVRIDTFARPQASWAGIGGVTLTRFEGATPDERGLQAVYRQKAGSIVAMMRMLPRGKLQGLNRLSLKVSSLKATTLLFQLEEAGGGKFNTAISVPDGAAGEAHTIDFADLNAADDSKVKDRKVKPELVTQLVILDVSGAMGAVGDSDNTLRIGSLHATAAK